MEQPRHGLLIGGGAVLLVALASSAWAVPPLPAAGPSSGAVPTEAELMRDFMICLAVENRRLEQPFMFPFVEAIFWLN